MIKSGRVRRVTLGLSAFALIVIGIASQLPKQQLGEDALPLQKNPSVIVAPDFTQYADVRLKKRKFFEYLRPKVEAENGKIRRQRQHLIQIANRLDNGEELTHQQQQVVTEIAKQYKVSLRHIDSGTIELLLERVDVIPVEMVLVQAANESGWGSSRFALEGNNYFGQWCFTAGCGLVPNKRTTGMTHEVAKFGSSDESVAAYLLNLNTNAAYQELRQVRGGLRHSDTKVTAQDLVPTLIAYSERKQDYVDELLQMLDHNQQLM